MTYEVVRPSEANNMWPVMEPNIVRQLRGLEPHARLGGDLREYVRTEWNGDGGAVLGMIARAARDGRARRRAPKAGILRSLSDGIEALIAGAVAGRA
jgi:hypothetical protein